MEKVDYRFLRKQVVGPHRVSCKLAGLLAEVEYETPEL